MYEMYPDDWAAAAQPPTNGDQPRRRARRAHSVTPSILVQEQVVQGHVEDDQPRPEPA
ncbi:hypothetical protein GCM10022204_35770 [Microlunatus aurantiacus]|uniref:Uncharacterized protein n=1 Tax=Microlunatus aurantiacus TaxID=446786 RepID=A0ABP7E396_9ACTN